MNARPILPLPAKGRGGIVVAAHRKTRDPEILLVVGQPLSKKHEQRIALRKRKGEVMKSEESLKGIVQL